MLVVRGQTAVLLDRSQSSLLGYIILLTIIVPKVSRKFKVYSLKARIVKISKPMWQQYDGFVYVHR